MGNETYPIRHVISLGLNVIADSGEFISSSNANQKGIFSTAHFVKHTLTDGGQYAELPPAEERGPPVARARAAVQTAPPTWHVPLCAVHDAMSISVQWRPAQATQRFLARFSVSGALFSFPVKNPGHSNWVGKMKKTETTPETENGARNL